MDVADSAAIAARMLGWKTLKDVRTPFFAVLSKGYGVYVLILSTSGFDILFTPLAVIMKGQVFFS